MLKTYKDRLEKILQEARCAITALEKEAVIMRIDTLLLDVFEMVNDSIERDRAPSFVTEIQNLEFEIAETKEKLVMSLFRS